MAIGRLDDSKLTAIADKIRKCFRVTGKFSVDEFPDYIGKVPGLIDGASCGYMQLGGNATFPAKVDIYYTYAGADGYVERSVVSGVSVPSGSTPYILNYIMPGTLVEIYRCSGHNNISDPRVTGACTLVQTSSDYVKFYITGCGEVTVIL